MEKNRRMTKSIKNICFILRQISQYSKGRISISFITIICDIVEMMIFNVIFFPFIIKAIENNYNIKYYYSIGIIIVGILILAVIYRLWRDYLYIPYSNLEISSKFQKNIMNKSKTIDLIDFNNSKYYDKYRWVMSEADKRPVATLNTILQWIESLIMLSFVGGIVVSLEPVMMLFVIVPVVVNWIFSFYMNKIQYFYHKKQVEKQKIIYYINRVFYLPDYAQEIKTTEIREVLYKKFKNGISSLKKIIHKNGFKIGMLQFGEGTIINISSQCIALAYLSYLALVRKSLDVSEIIILSNSIWQLSSHFLRISNIIPQIQEHSKYIQDYRDFMEYIPQIKEKSDGKKPLTGSNALEIRNLSFGYGIDEQNVLKHIDMKIGAGEKIAIVGHNGAGKSTLIKLMMHLYEPSSGEILMDGINIQEYCLSLYRERFAVVFQDFKLYAVSVEENVMMEETKGKLEQKEKVKESLKSSGIWERIKSQEKTIETMMTKEFDDDGLVLSGGESQKIALARAFYKDAGIIILDEPSSALDPISEYKMNQNMMAAAEGKTVIMISHRLSTVIDADCIYYFEKGEIQEQGTHKELMKQNGKYAVMFRLQADAYEGKMKAELGNV